MWSSIIKFNIEKQNSILRKGCVKNLLFPFYLVSIRDVVIYREEKRRIETMVYFPRVSR